VADDFDESLDIGRKTHLAGLAGKIHINDPLSVNESPPKSSDTSPLAILITLTALPIASEGRFLPLGLVGTLAITEFFEDFFWGL
jgi:hypothetical protein